MAAHKPPAENLPAENLETREPKNGGGWVG